MGTRYNNCWNGYLFLLLILLFSSCSQKKNVTVIKMTKRTVESTVSSISAGTINAKNQSELSFGTVGRIAKIYVKNGDVVKAGQVIAELENADLKAIYRDAETEYDRSLELFKDGLVSKAALELAVKNKEVSKGNLDKTIIKAPFNGMLTAMELHIGEYNQSNLAATNKRAAIQIIDMEKRIIKGEIDEVDIQKVAINKAAKIKIPAYRGLIFTAHITNVVPFVSTLKDQDRSMQIELEIDGLLEGDRTHAPKIIPVGLSADIEVIVESKKDVWAVPMNYVGGVGTRRFVWVLENNKAHKKEIKLGLFNYEFAEILSGLAEQDEVLKAPNGVELGEGDKVHVVEHH